MSENPFRAAGEWGSLLEEIYYQTVEPGAHLLLFTLLGLLGLLPRCPLKRQYRLLLLAAYAVGAEALQAFIPPRTPQWSDVAQNLAGLALGAGIWWAITCWRARHVEGGAPLVDSRTSNHLAGTTEMEPVSEM